VTDTYQNHRMSALPFTQYCAKAGHLSGDYSGSSARLSTAFHMMTAKTDRWEEFVARLSDEDEAEIKTWKIPAEVDLGNGTVLRYEDAEKEVAMGLTADLGYCDINSAKAVTRGHMDHGWVVDYGGERWVYCPDIKRSEWTVVDGPKSLQIAAYGFAFAAKHDADVFVPGIWAATEGTYWWGEPVRLASVEAIRLGKRVLAAAQNVPSKDNMYTLGAHCTGCYGRERCPSYLIPMEHANSTLGPFAANRLDKPLTPEEALNILILAKRAKETVEVVEREVKERVRRGLKVIDPQTGLQYGVVHSRGREGLSKALIEAAGLDPAKFMERGKEFDSFRWVKP